MKQVQILLTCIVVLDLFLSRVQLLLLLELPTQIFVYRNARGHSYLKDMLHPLVTSLLEDKSVKINTNPIEVYKNWVNQQETETGVAR